MEPNFSGFVSKADLECTDGRTIKPGAFAHQDGEIVPLVYQHNHTDVNQVLGKVKLTEKPEGLWGDVYLNETQSGKNADALVKHGDLKKFSIWAKDLVERGMDVVKGQVQEVSLCLAGANAGANVQNYREVLAHSGMDEDDVLLVVGGEIEHDSIATDKPVSDEEAQQAADALKAEEEAAATSESDKTVGDVLATLTDEQKTAMNSAIDDIVTEAVTEALAEAPELEHGNLNDSPKGSSMSRNIFQNDQENKSTGPELKHSDVQSILLRAKGNPDNIKGINPDQAVGSLKELVRSDAGKELMHADTYGIQNMEVLFPDAQKLMNTPTFVDRRQEWVKTFMAGTSKSPFSRVKTVYADITADEARARGYIKAGKKVDEVFPVFKRSTGPTMIYKRQKLDRQDIIDIIDFDVVAWMKAEMRGKLDEEIARAALFGDGRPAMVGGNLNPDKIPDPGAANTSGDGIRAIVNDNDLYTVTYSVPMPATPVGTDWNRLLDASVEASEDYMGSGNKTAFMTYRTASKLLTIRDDFGHRIYRNLSEVAGDMDVARIERVPTELMPAGVLAIVLDLADYNFGMGRGGEVTMFDDFDIDFNQFKYLIETYLSGALTLPYSAFIFKQTLISDPTVAPTLPVISNNVVTIPTQTGVVYRNNNTGQVVAQGSTITLDATTLKSVTIEAIPAAGYQFESNSDRKDSKTYNYKA